MHAPSRLATVVSLLMLGTLALAKPVRSVKPRGGKPAAAQQKPAVPPVTVDGPNIDRADTAPEDIDVSNLPPPKVKPPLRGAPVPEPDRPVSGDDGGHFRFRGNLAFAQFQYTEQGGPAPVTVTNLFLSGGLEISRLLLGGWILGAAVDSPILTLESGGAVNFGPLLARFSVGHEIALGARWNGEIYLSYLFETPVGRRGASGFSRIGGVHALLRARYHPSVTRALEIEVAAAFLDSRQDGFKTGDRYLALQLTYLFRSSSGMSAIGPFIAADETKAQFPDRRTAGGRVRLGVLAEF